MMRLFFIVLILVFGSLNAAPSLGVYQQVIEKIKQTMSPHVSAMPVRNTYHLKGLNQRTLGLNHGCGYFALYEVSRILMALNAPTMALASPLINQLVGAPLFREQYNIWITMLRSAGKEDVKSPDLVIENLEYLAEHDANLKKLVQANQLILIPHSYLLMMPGFNAPFNAQTLKNIDKAIDILKKAPQAALGLIMGVDKPRGHFFGEVIVKDASVYSYYLMDGLNTSLLIKNAHPILDLIQRAIRAKKQFSALYCEEMLRKFVEASNLFISNRNREKLDGFALWAKPDASKSIAADEITLPGIRDFYRAYSALDKPVINDFLKANLVNLLHNAKNYLESKFPNDKAPDLLIDLCKDFPAEQPEMVRTEAKAEEKRVVAVTPIATVPVVEREVIGVLVEPDAQKNTDQIEADAKAARDLADRLDQEAKDARMAQELADQEYARTLAIQ